MSQFMSQHLGQHMRLEQRLTPQLIQSMAVLQKPVADLEAYIESMLESNAALEVDEPEATDETVRDTADRDEREQDNEDGRFDRLHALPREFDPDFHDRAPARSDRISHGGDPDAKLGAMANTAGRAIGLQEHLLAQWTLTDHDETLRRAGEAVINHLDPDGYLRVRLEEIATNVRPPSSVETLEAALVEVRKLEPFGVGAQNLVECLLLQLGALPGDNGMERALIENHLDDIAHNRLPAIAKATGYSLGEINEALKAMHTTLCLHPGYLVGDRSVPHIRPDVLVEYAETGGGLTVQLTRGNMPKLRVRDDVAAMAKTKDNGRETRDFARKHVEEATTLIDAVKFRQSRLLEVARAILEKQREFFDLGPHRLKVLRMGDMAEELGCDPSTISRTVAEKYMQSPRGIYPLRYFFTGGTENEDGESIGWDRVKTRVRELIDAEDRKNPLNDEQVAARLKSEGIEISRRTVAKYRQQLDIPATRQRRQY